MILKLEKTDDTNFLSNNNGLYKLYVNEEILNKLKNALNLNQLNNELIEGLIYNDTFYYCVYVGKCKRNNGFEGRINRNHMRGSIDNSTLRRTLVALLKYSEDELKDHLNNDNEYFFQIFPFKNEDLILGLEEKMINASVHILNIDDNHFYGKPEYFDSKEILRELRKKHKLEGED